MCCAQSGDIQQFSIQKTHPFWLKYDESQALLCCALCQRQQLFASQLVPWQILMMCSGRSLGEQTHLPTYQEFPEWLQAQEWPSGDSSRSLTLYSHTTRNADSNLTWTVYRHSTRNFEDGAECIKKEGSNNMHRYSDCKMSWWLSAKDGSGRSKRKNSSQKQLSKSRLNRITKSCR